MSTMGNGETARNMALVDTHLPILTIMKDNL